MTVAEQWEQLWLPLFPLASDDLPAGVDREDALMRALWNRHDWLPNAVVGAGRRLGQRGTAAGGIDDMSSSQPAPVRHCEFHS
jgi:hypothetical protein